MRVGAPSFAFAVSAMLIGAAPLAAHAQTTTSSVTTETGKAGASATTKMTATVVSIDVASREVVLIDSNGKTHNINVSDQARNLDQVKVGDKVTAEYSEAISLQLKKRGTSGSAPLTAQEAMVRSPKGAKPGGAVGRKVTAIATVVAIDTKKQFVTLRGPKGNEYDVQVPDPAQLKAIAKGDEVEVVYTEALAVSVQSAPGPK
jgi:Cu/Ag efflux protein CusF